MIVLNKNSTSKIVLTLSENVTLTAPVYFLFEIISDDTKESVFFTAEDISSNVCRYNEFDITLTSGATDNTIGLINLELNGYYKYNVYQQDIEFNLDPTLTSGIIENGKLYVKGDIKPIKSTYNDNDNNTYITYE
tara:strand:- start:1012 stop:1416 length:405 start_codon:yes stop_codon:yes gene_type:complete